MRNIGENDSKQGGSQLLGVLTFCHFLFTCKFYLLKPAICLGGGYRRMTQESNIGLSRDTWETGGQRTNQN